MAPTATSPQAGRPDDGDANAEPGGSDRRRSLAQRPALLAAAVVGVVLALLVVLLATRDSSGERLAQADLIGQQAPAVNGEVLLGQPIDLGASDRWTVVNFFATWCTPCIQEHPELKAFSEEHATIGDARVISVVYDDKPGAVTEFFQERGGDWTVLDADQGRTALDWGVAKIPESYVVAPTGVIVERLVGGVTKDNLDQIIAAYAQPAPSPSTPAGP